VQACVCACMRVCVHVCVRTPPHPTAAQHQGMTSLRITGQSRDCPALLSRAPTGLLNRAKQELALWLQALRRLITGCALLPPTSPTLTLTPTTDLRLSTECATSSRSVMPSTTCVTPSLDSDTRWYCGGWEGEGRPGVGGRVGSEGECWVSGPWRCRVTCGRPRGQCVRVRGERVAWPCRPREMRPACP